MGAEQQKEISAADLLLHECQLADRQMRKWVRVPVKLVRQALDEHVSEGVGWEHEQAHDDEHCLGYRNPGGLGCAGVGRPE